MCWGRETEMKEKKLTWPNQLRDSKLGPHRWQASVWEIKNNERNSKTDKKMKKLVDLPEPRRRALWVKVSHFSSD